MGLSFTIAADPRQRMHFQVQVLQDSWPHFTVSDLRLPQPGAQVPVFYIPQEQGGPIIMQNTKVFVQWLRNTMKNPSENIKIKLRTS
jgi:hypothetical protein